MDNTRCGGQELEMSECRFDSWGENDCDPSEAAGVVCDAAGVEKPDLTTTERPATTEKITKHQIKVTAAKSVLGLARTRSANAMFVYESENRLPSGWDFNAPQHVPLNHVDDNVMFLVLKTLYLYDFLDNFIACVFLLNDIIKRTNYY